MKKAFNDENYSNRKCHILAENYELALHLERSSVSELSPNIVEDKELLARQIFSPIHINDKGDITPAAFDDVLNKGLSVNRVNYISLEDIHLFGESKAETDRQYRSDRKYLGFILATVTEVRECVLEEKRLFAVYDTALETAVHHADICSISLGAIGSLPKKAANKKRRLILKQKFGSLIPTPYP